MDREAKRTPRQTVQAVQQQAKQLGRRVAGSVIAQRFGHPSRHLRVIVVTGEAGKTTTARFLQEILHESRFTTAVWTSDQIAIAGQLQAPMTMTAWRLQSFFRQAKKAGADYVVLEMDQQALAAELCRGVAIEGVIVTYAPVDGAGEALCEAVSALQPRFIVLNRDDEGYDALSCGVAREQKMTFGVHQEAEAQIAEVTLYRKGTEAEVVLDHQTHLELATYLLGRHNVMNMTAAVTLAYLLGVRLQDIQEGVANLETLPGRYERMTGHEADVLVDAAPTPRALAGVLEMARETAKGRVIAVIGAPTAQYDAFGEVVMRGADRIFLSGSEADEAVQEASQSMHEALKERHGGGKTTVVVDRREAIERAIGSARKGDMVVVAGLGQQDHGMMMQDEQLPWNDAAVTRAVIGQGGAMGA